MSAMPVPEGEGQPEYQPWPGRRLEKGFHLELMAHVGRVTSIGIVYAAGAEVDQQCIRMLRPRALEEFSLASEGGGVSLQRVRYTGREDHHPRIPFEGNERPRHHSGSDNHRSGRCEGDAAASESAPTQC